MVEKIFLSVLNMSITGGYVILFLLAARLLFRKLPKIYSYGLWTVAAFRLVCPFSFSSAFSLLWFAGNSRLEYVPADIGLMAQPRISLGISAVDRVVNQSLPAATPYNSINPMQILLSAASLVWLVGVAALLAAGAISYWMLKRRLSDAVRTKEGVYESDRIQTPMVAGFWRPKIYLPYGIAGEERSYVLRHERIHIRRRDHLFKLLAGVLVCIYWFHPLIWVAFFAMTRDMEMSCDEQVIKEMGAEIKKPYSLSLLSMARGRGLPLGSPLAFGESHAKSRIRNVLSYRRPVFWISLGGLLLAAVLIMGLAANPRGEAETPESDPAGQGYTQTQLQSQEPSGMMEGETSIGETTAGETTTGQTNVEETEQVTSEGSGQRWIYPGGKLPRAQAAVYFQGALYFRSDAQLDLDPASLVQIGQVTSVVEDKMAPAREQEANTGMVGDPIYDSGDNLIVEHNGDYALYSEELPGVLAVYCEMREMLSGYPDKYSPEQAVEQGLFVSLHGRLLSGEEPLTNFWQAVETETPAWLTVVSYTVEGDPVFGVLYFDGMGFAYMEDASRDNFGAGDWEFKIAVYPYLKKLEDARDVCLVLTEDEEETWQSWEERQRRSEDASTEQIRSAMICFWSKDA